MSLDHLNGPQRQAVLHDHGPLLVLAGAGTGKTSVITHRIAHMVTERGVDPHAILAVTFTNKAAREMRERAVKLIGPTGERLETGTFHRVCGKLLRRWAPRVGRTSNFVIYDADDQLQLIKRSMAELNMDSQAIAPKAVRNIIEGFKNQGQGPQHARAEATDPVAQAALKVYQLYQERCQQANAIDFSDMLLLSLALVRDHEDVRLSLQQRWSHLLVDEYQDTNPVQYMWLRHLVTPNHSLSVVGDDDQSIYRWRGADIGNILRFERDFLGATVIRLEQNYRSTQTILQVANAVIAHNAARKGKTLFSKTDVGAKVRLGIFATEREEGISIAQTIERMLKDGTQGGEVALLYRTNAQSRPLEDALRNKRIAYVILGGVRFYDRKEVKDALSYLRLLVNPQSTLDFLRVVNVPSRALGKTSVQKIAEASQLHQKSLFAAAQELLLTSALSGKAKAGLATFVNTITNGQKSLSQGHKLGEVLGHTLQDAGYLAALRQEASEEAQERLHNLEELAAALDEYADLTPSATLDGFLEEVALSTDSDNVAEQGGQVVLMTLHAAKGLEFEHVFLPGLEEGLFPHMRSLSDHAAIEEERRLCYVGITRAKKSLMISAAKVRSIYGRTELSQMSRFLNELPEDLIEVLDEAPSGALDVHDEIVQRFLGEDARGSDDQEGASHAMRDLERRRRLRVANSARHVPSVPTVKFGQSDYPVGAKVLHPSFGEGQVMLTEGEGKRTKLVVQFASVGRKVVIAQFVERAG